MRMLMLAAITAATIIVPIHAADAKAFKVQRAEYTQLKQPAPGERARAPAQSVRNDKGVDGPSADPQCKTLLCNNFILIGVGF